MQKHPKVVYAADASAINSSKEHRRALKEIVHRFCEPQNKPETGIFAEIVPIFKDFDRSLTKYNEDPMGFIRGYLCTEMLKSRIPGIVPIFLGWLCAFHREEAEDFYRKTDLATKEMPFRPYPKMPGSWAAAQGISKVDRFKSPGAASIAEELAAIIPRQSASALQSVSLHPAKAPITLPHPGGVSFADFSPCGRYIVVAGRHRRGFPAGAFIWVLDEIAGSSNCHTITLAAEGDVRTVTFSPDSRFVIWTTDRKARLSYAHALTQPLFEIEHADKISYCAFSEDGKWIALASWDRTVRIWDAANGKMLSTISPDIRDGHVVNSAYFTKDKKRILIACSDCRIEIWDISSKKVVSAFVADRQDWVCGAIFSRDETEILSAGPESGSAYIWDVTSTKVKLRFGRKEAHKDTVVSAYFSSNEHYVLTASEDGCAFVWSVKSQSVVLRLTHAAKVLVAHFSPSGSQILTACDDGNVYLWDFS